MRWCKSVEATEIFAKFQWMTRSFTVLEKWWLPKQETFCCGIPALFTVVHLLPERPRLRLPNFWEQLLTSVWLHPVKLLTKLLFGSVKMLTRREFRLPTGLTTTTQVVERPFLGGSSRTQTRLFKTWCVEITKKSSTMSEAPVVTKSVFTTLTKRSSYAPQIRDKLNWEIMLRDGKNSKFAILAAVRKPSKAVTVCT